MKKTEIIKRLSLLIDDLETGYIANPSAKAEAKRARYEKFLKDLKQVIETDSVK